jgi:predicted MarR family transcription regulator
MDNHRKPDPPEPIVSSAHLAAGSLPTLSELEYGLIIASHAFQRWMARCMAAAGVPNLSPVEVLVLNTVRHRNRPKTLADICLVLNIEDTHVANYAIRKLTSIGLVHTGRAGKAKTTKITEAGLATLQRYSDIRERLLVRAIAVSGMSPSALSESAAQLRALSGYYEQAARAAATL